MTAVHIHGVRLGLPGAWTDQSVYRFVPPDGASRDPLVNKLRSNLLVTRHEVPDGLPMDAVFAGPNAATLKANPDFRVQRSGRGLYLEQEAFWQEVAFTDPRAFVQVFQWQLALRPSPKVLVMVTLTAPEEKARLALVTELGFAAS